MTKKDYIAIAKAIKDARMNAFNVDGTCNIIAHNIADVLQSDNARFDRERFLLACGVAPG